MGLSMYSESLSNQRLGFLLPAIHHVAKWRTSHGHPPAPIISSHVCHRCNSAIQREDLSAIYAGSCASLIEKYQLHILHKMLKFDEMSNKGIRSCYFLEKWTCACKKLPCIAIFSQVDARKFAFGDSVRLFVLSSLNAWMILVIFANIL